MDLCRVVVLQFGCDLVAMWLIEPNGHVENTTLKPVRSFITETWPNPIVVHIAADVELKEDTVYSAFAIGYAANDLALIVDNIEPGQTRI